MLMFICSFLCIFVYCYVLILLYYHFLRLLSFILLSSYLIIFLSSDLLIFLYFGLRILFYGHILWTVRYDKERMGSRRTRGVGAALLISCEGENLLSML